MSRDPSAGSFNEGRPDDCWSWHPGWYLPGPSGTAATASQFPGWTPSPYGFVPPSFTPPGFVPPGFAPQPLPASADIQRQVEEAVQRALQAALPVALGSAAVRPPSPPPPPPVSSSAPVVPPRSEDESSNTTTAASPAASTLSAPGLALRTTASAHASSTAGSGTTNPNPVGGEPIIYSRTHCKPALGAARRVPVFQTPRLRQLPRGRRPSRVGTHTVGCKILIMRIILKKDIILTVNDWINV